MDNILLTSNILSMLVHSDVTCSLGRQYRTLVGREVEGGSLLFTVCVVLWSGIDDTVTD